MGRDIYGLTSGSRKGCELTNDQDVQLDLNAAKRIVHDRNKSN